ncbi:MAG: CoA transferase [Firmicutes bacterium]|nr:CoA transferase [Bacillota bacterium]
MQLPLEGIRVLDLSRLLPGPLCTLFLADLGAEVIKVEDHAGGDYIRWFEPRMKHQSAFFYVLNRNKKSIRLNLRDEEGRGIFKKIVKDADVLVETFRPGAMDRLGLGWQHLKEINPGLVYCSLTGYGQEGPYKDWPGHDVNYLSLAGVLGMIGTREGRPVIPGIQIADVGAGALPAAVAILAALFGKQRTGKGQFLDVAMVDGAILFLSMHMARYMADGDPHKMANELLSGAFAFYNIYQAGDGRYVAVGCLEEKFWNEFCRAIEREDLIAEMFAEEPRRSEIIAEVAEIMKTRTSDEWLALLKDYDVCFTRINTFDEALQDPYIKHRNLWFMKDYGPEGQIPQMAFPVKFSDIEPGWVSPPPELGEHTGEVLRSMGYSEEEIAELAKKKVI